MCCLRKIKEKYSVEILCCEVYIRVFVLGIVTPWGQDLRTFIARCSREQGLVLGDRRQVKAKPNAPRI